LGVTKLTVDQQKIRQLERALAIAKMKRDILKNMICKNVPTGSSHELCII
jgi:hypothetical protein